LIITRGRFRIQLIDHITQTKRGRRIDRRGVILWM
jgi:hypothetical protein